MSAWRLAWRLARRELRGGIAGFRVFLACLALGVAAIAAVGMVRGAIEAGLSAQGAVLLGGDAQLRLTYRFATPAERAWMEGRAARVSEVVDFRSMAVAGSEGAEERALTQVKAVDEAWPLLGEAVLDPPLPLAEALAGGGRAGGAQPGDLPGGVMERALASRLGIAPGDTFRLGLQTFRLTAILISEPDSGGGALALGPRTLVRSAALAGSGLLAPGTLFETDYRLLLRPGDSLPALEAAARAAFAGAGMAWRDRTAAAPGVEEFVRRTGAFLVLVGLAGLAVGGVGVQAAVRAHLAGKVATIATLRTLGAEGGLILRIYLMQIGVLAVAGVAAGLVLGAGVPLALAPLIAAALPFPAVFAPYPAPLAEAAFYGLAVALLFTLWPLARVERVRAAALYRGGGGEGWPRPRWLAALAVAAAALVGGAAWASGMADMTLWAAAGVAAALAVLAAAALALRALARWARRRLPAGRVALRLALAAIGGPRDEAMPVVLALGLGLSVLAAVGQIDANLRAAITRELPGRAPAFFVLDIQPDQIDGFRALLAASPAVTRVETAPMLRGVITRLNGRPVAEVSDHWVFRGDRGLTYSETPGGARITAGEWWPAGYEGPAQISFAAAEAAEIGLRLGDRLTVNVLGRDIEATVTSFREVDFSSAGMGFIMAMNPAALRGAPHSVIATVYAAPEAEAAILREISRAWPNITAIGVREAIGRVAEALSAIAAATAWAASATLATGFAVLIGAAAAGEGGRIREAAILRTLGATRGRMLASFALRSALAGAAAGVVAVEAGGAAGWAVMRFVMEAAWRFEPLSALAIVAGGVAATLLAGLVFALRSLAARPAQVLRAGE